jgi:DNA-binding response OmpR family regulator
MAVMRVMVVTHDAERQARLREFLGDRGYELSIPPDRQHLLSNMKEATPHVLVLDLYAADPNAAEILRSARAEGYRGKVVVLAGPSTSAALSACWQMGIDQVVGSLQATGGAFDPGRVEVAIRASFEKEIAQRAYQLWVQLGRPKAQDRETRAQAEDEVISQFGHSAQAATSAAKHEERPRKEQ